MTETEYLEIAKRTNRTIKFFRVRKNSPTVEFVAEGAKLHFGNRDIDTLTCTVPVGFLKKDDQVVVSYKTVHVFRGSVESRVAHRSRGLTASETVTVSGPWSKMSRLVYRQNWNTGSGFQLSSRLILNQHQSGTRQNLSSELREILTHGKDSCGYTVGAISVPNQYLPFDECRDITIADAVKRELRFFPKSIVRFDYSKTTPEIVITRADAGADAAYVADIPKTQREHSYTEHPITGVDLEIETTGEIQGVQYRNITHQKAGDTAAGNPDCLYATLKLAGASSSNTRQTFDSKTEDIPADLNDIEWWQSKHPRIATIDPAHLSITEGTRSGAADAAKYPRISGNSAGEIEAAGLKCRAEKFTCKVTIDSGYETEENMELTMFFLTTNATTRKYSWVSDSSATTAETVPSGLAAAILADRSGELLQERMTIRLGASFPTLGDSCDGLFLQAFDVDCEDLTAELTFGQPDHLSPEDMASLLSGFRNKCTSTASASRSTGKKEDDAKDEEEVGGIPPLSSSEFCPGTKKKTTVQAADQSTGAIELDAEKVEAGKKMEVHTLTIKGKGTASGATTRAAGDASGSTDLVLKVLATDDIELDPSADDSQCVKKDKTPADNRFDSGKGVSFGSDASKFSLSANTSNLALVLDHTTGQLLVVPVDVDSTIVVKRRKLQVNDGGSGGSPAIGYTTIGYGNLIINGISGQPYISFRSAGTQVASIQPNSSTSVLYINSAEYGIALNGKQDNIKILTTPTATLENATNDLNIANLKWIVSQLKQLKLNGTDSGVKLLATANVDIKQKQLVAGKGITLSEANGKITISTTGSDSSGSELYNGELILGGPVSYANHQITQQVYNLTVTDGLITAASKTSNPPITAVEETV